MALRFYHAIAFQQPGDEHGDGWDALFPDFPGCVSQGDSAEEALKGAIEALALHVEGMIAGGSELPPESHMHAPPPEWLPKDALKRPIHALLPVEVPGKNLRINITMDGALVERLDAAARREGTTRSGYLAQAAREKLQRSRELA